MTDPHHNVKKEIHRHRKRARPLNKNASATETKPKNDKDELFTDLIHISQEVMKETRRRSDDPAEFFVRNSVRQDFCVERACWTVCPYFHCGVDLYFSFTGSRKQADRPIL
jgi:hypothetical protein